MEVVEMVEREHETVAKNLLYILFIFFFILPFIIYHVTGSVSSQEILNILVMLLEMLLWKFFQCQHCLKHTRCQVCLQFQSLTYSLFTALHLFVIYSAFHQLKNSEVGRFIT